MLRSVSSLWSHATTHNGVYEKGHHFFSLVLLRESDGGLDSTNSRLNDVAGTHVALWLGVPLLEILPDASLGVGSVSILQNSCGPQLNSRHFGLKFKTQTNAIHYCQNTPPTRHPGQLLTILVLAFSFCNNYTLSAIDQISLFTWDLTQARCDTRPV